MRRPAPGVAGSGRNQLSPPAKNNPVSFFFLIKLRSSGRTGIRCRAARRQVARRSPPASLDRLVFVCFSAWARVELTVSPSVEVFLGDTATIQCQHTFKDISQEPALVITQMFVVSPSRRRSARRRGEMF